MSLILVSSDLTLYSLFEGLARSVGVSFASASLLVARESVNHDTELVLLDLALANLNVAKLAPSLREAAPHAKIIAFGPHVHERRLSEASEAGCDEVLSRGQLHARANELVAMLTRPH